MIKVSFKNEDVIHGHTVGPVHVYRGSQEPEYHGWQTKADAVELSEQLNAEFQEI